MHKHVMNYVRERESRIFPRGTGFGTQIFLLLRLGLAALILPHHVDKLVLSLSDLATSRHWRARDAYNQIRVWIRIY